MSGGSVADDPDRADPTYSGASSGCTSRATIHWAGDMHFGPDGYL